MSENVANDTPTTTPTEPDFFLDGEAPRLAAAPLVTPHPTAPAAPAVAPTIELPADAPSLPVVSPVLTTTPADDEAPTPTDAQPDDDDSVPGSAESALHPMAHLMPERSTPSEASLRAAELRAAKKVKGRKIKIGVAAGFLVFAALVGPPLFSWLSNAINEAGNVSVEEPAD